MTEDEQFKLCLMLAMQAVFAQDEVVSPKDTAQKISDLARLIGEFFGLQFTWTFPIRRSP